MDTEQLKEKTVRMLMDVGMEVENEELSGAMLARGCKALPNGRIGVPRELVEEFVLRQKPHQAEDDDDQSLHPYCGIDWAHWIMWTGQKEQMKKRLKEQFLMSAFDCGPTRFHDYATGKDTPVDTDTFIMMKKLAQATPEIGYMSTWYRQDVPEGTERIASLILALRYTDKVDGIEAIKPAVIKYLVEIGEIMSGKPKDGRYLAGSECIISPMVFEKRSADDTVERARVGVKEFHIASMPAIGVNMPLTPAAVVVMSSAELLAGMVAAWCIAPEGDITGRMISTQMDMRTADVTSANPEAIMIDLAVKQLFDECFGGHLWTEVFFSPSASEPGMLAVYQNFYAVGLRALLTGDATAPYPGVGTLHNGACGSPTQLMLDMEIRRSQWAVQTGFAVNDDTVPYEEIVQRCNDGSDFLRSDHTLDRWRSLWNSDVLPLTVPSTSTDMNKEKGILDKCDEKWRANVEAWEPPTVDEDKVTALEGVLARAEKEML